MAACLGATGCLAAPEQGEFDGDDSSATPRVLSNFSEPDLEIPDDSNAGISDTILIDEPCTLDWVEVDVQIEHPWRGDLFLTLTSPSGTLLVLKQILDDDGARNVEGTYPDTLTPFQDLSLFFEEEGQGTWTLTASDLSSDDEGTLVAWGVVLECAD